MLIKPGMLSVDVFDEQDVRGGLLVGELGHLEVGEVVVVVGGVGGVVEHGEVEGLALVVDDLGGHWEFMGGSGF